MIIFIIIWSSCQTKTPSLNQNGLDEYFDSKNNDSFIIGLNQILSFFDSLVIENTKILAVDSAYHIYMKNLMSAEIATDIHDILNIDLQKVVSFIDNNFSTSHFNKIWEYSYGMIPQNLDSNNKKFQNFDTVSVYISPNLNGVYYNILEKAIEIDTSFKEYKEHILEVGDISPTIVLGFQDNNKLFDTKNDLIRLVISIHYMTIIYKKKYIK